LCRPRAVGSSLPVGVSPASVAAIWGIVWTRAAGTHRTAADGIVGDSAVTGSWTSASPPRSKIRRSPREPSEFAPVSTTPTVAAPYASAAEQKVTSIDGRLYRNGGSDERVNDARPISL